MRDCFSSAHRRAQHSWLVATFHSPCTLFYHFRQIVVLLGGKNTAPMRENFLGVQLAEEVRRNLTAEGWRSPELHSLVLIEVATSAAKCLLLAINALRAEMLQFLASCLKDITGSPDAPQRTVPTIIIVMKERALAVSVLQSSVFVHIIFLNI